MKKIFISFFLLLSTIPAFADFQNMCGIDGYSVFNAIYVPYTQQEYVNTPVDENDTFTCAANTRRVFNAVYERATYVCAPGYYLPTNADACAACPAGQYCSGGTYTFNETTTQGLTGVCPIGTYLDTTGGASVNDCLPCSGATYADETGMPACKSCPTSYNHNTDSGKTSVTQCQIHCNAGTYVATAGIIGYTQLEYIEATGTQYIDTGITYGYNDSGSIKMDIEFDTLSYVGALAYLQVGISNSCLTIQGTSSYCVSPYQRNLLEQYWNGNTHVSALYANDQLVISKSFSNYQTRSYYIFNLGGMSVSKSKGRIYSLKLIKNGELVRDMIPVRRDDGAIGMYDKVNNVFYTNAGTGTFIAGPDIGVACENVGAGYYAGASTVNYGSVGTRTACPAGTYSNIENAATCTSCSGATYNDETGMAACKSCPTGYTYNITAGKDDIADCQTHCDAGTYVEHAGGYTQLEYIESTGTQYVDTGIIPTNYNWSAEFRMSASGWGKYFFGMGVTSGNYWGGNGYQFGIAATGGASSWGGASSNTTASILGVSQNVFYNYKMTKNGFYVNDVLKAAIASPADYVATASLYIGRSNNPQGASYNNGNSKWAWVKIYDDSNTLVFDGVPARRDSDGTLGMYDKVTNTFFTNAGTGTFTAGSDVGAIGGACENVGAGYYAAASTVNYGSVGTRTACPVGTTTVGYGHGADSANDCGRVLHIGDHIVYSRRNKETPHALHARFGDSNEMFYISLSSTNHNMSRLHLSVDGNQYTAYDDSLFYGERDFDTGQQIVQ